MSPTKVLFKLSGSIACYKACHLISRWAQEGKEVQTVASAAALKFVGASTLEGLTGKPVYSDLFESGRQMAHIDLVKWADFSLLCPATANTLNKLANGLGDDLLGSLFLAHDFAKPYFAAPAMNTAMYRHPATRESLGKLKSWGVHILPTGRGRLACGDTGQGKLLEPDLVWESVEHYFANLKGPDRKPLRLLITSGGTEEAIDGVRSITNSSSGQTGARFADYFFKRGDDVTLFKAERAIPPEQPVEVVDFATFHDLDNQLKGILGRTHFDAVIHLAAVSDYSVDHILIDGRKVAPNAVGKLSSGHEISLQLAPNHKIVDRLRHYSLNRSMQVVAFKLTQNASEKEGERAVLDLLRHSSADIVVHNDLSEVDPENGKHVAALYRGGVLTERVTTKDALIRSVESLLVNSPAKS